MTIINKEEEYKLVAVYGTLRKGGKFFNSTLKEPLKRKEITFLTTMDTMPVYTMYDLGTYPGLQKGGTTPIRIEIYRVTKEILDKLNQIEGYKKGNEKYNLYNIEKIDTPFGKALIYLFNKNNASWLDDIDKIESGDWQEFTKIQK